MIEYTLEELRNNPDIIREVVSNAAVADDFAKIRIGEELAAVVISEREWEMLSDAFVLLIGGKKLK